MRSMNQGRYIWCRPPENQPRSDTFPESHRRGGLFNQRQVVVLKARDLVGGCTEILQEIDGSFIKRRTKADQAQLTGPLHDRGMPFPGGVGLFIEVVEVLASPEGIGIDDLEAAAAHVERYRVGGVGLQLDRVGPGLGRCFHDCQSALQTLVVVVGHLGDHKRGIPRTRQGLDCLNSHRSIDLATK